MSARPGGANPAISARPSTSLSATPTSSQPPAVLASADTIGPQPTEGNLSLDELALAGVNKASQRIAFPQVVEGR
jgi:hypothetical protein